MRQSSWVHVAVILSLTSCVGNIGDNASPGSRAEPTRPPVEPPPVRFACEGDTQAEGELSRLSRNHYEHAIRDLLETFLGGAHPEVRAELETLFDRIPDDRRDHHEPFAVMDQSVSVGHVSSYLEVGEGLGQSIASAPGAIDTLTGCRADPSAACVERFIRRFGSLAFSRPLEESEVRFFLEVYDAPGLDSEGIADIVTVTLNAPQFLYRVEHGEAQVSGDVYVLSDFEVAKRLAGVLWQSIPDGSLLTAAETGELATDEGFAAVVDRMLDDPKFERTTETFIEEWFQLDRIGDFASQISNPEYAAFAGSLTPAPDLHHAMVDEVAESFRYHAQQGDGFFTWFESNYAFTTHPQLAEIYGVPTWDGASEPPRFPEGERAGLITRAGMVATASATTRPILKGVMLRQLLLCDSLAPPPPEADVTVPTNDGLQTTREAVEVLTEIPGTSCISCHGLFINHLGYPTEAYDALGRFRTDETILDDDGNVLGTRPVDTSAVPRVDIDDETPVADAAELVARLMESEKLEACFARQLFRYTRARLEDDQANGCALEETRTTAGDSLRNTLTGSLRREDFRQRRMLEVTSR